MYKTISIQNSTYRELQAIANQLNKPKSQVIDDLVKKQSEKMSKGEGKKLQLFNEHIAKLSADIKLPKGTKVNTDTIDDDFTVLADTDYMP